MIDQECVQAADLMRKEGWFRHLSQIASLRALKLRSEIEVLMANPNHGIHRMMLLSDERGLRQEEAKRIAAITDCSCDPANRGADRVIRCPEHLGPWYAGCAACWVHLFELERTRWYA